LGRKAADLTNATFGRLIALSPSTERCGTSIMWKCKCSCGNNLLVSSAHLKSGHTKSCGCLQKESIKARSFKHGACKTKDIEGDVQLDYCIWMGIKSRCYNKNSEKYCLYGGVGIKVYKPWIKDFLNFAKYIRSLPNCPSESLLKSRGGGKRLLRTLDRMNNRGSYTPGNLRWATKKEQANNCTSNRSVLYKNKKMTLSEAVDKYSVVCYKTVYNRLFLLDWTLKQALTTPVA
jgi:hypothetical protein